MSVGIAELFKRRTSDAGSASRVSRIQLAEPRISHWVVVTQKGLSAHVDIIGISTIAMRSNDYSLIFMDGEAFLVLEGPGRREIEIRLMPGHEVGFACHPKGSNALASRFTFCSFATMDEADAHAAIQRAGHASSHSPRKNAGS